MAHRKEFQISITGSARQLFERVRLLADHNKVKLTGDEFEGEFKGKTLVGSYRVDGDTLFLTIIKKPAMASWLKIEKEIDLFFNSHSDEKIAEMMRLEQLRQKAREKSKRYYRR